MFQSPLLLFGHSMLKRRNHATVTVTCLSSCQGSGESHYSANYRDSLHMNYSKCEVARAQANYRWPAVLIKGETAGSEDHFTTRITTKFYKNCLLCHLKKPNLKKEIYKIDSSFKENKIYQLRSSSTNNACKNVPSI